MPVLQVALDIPDDAFNRMLDTLQSMRVVLQPPGVSLYKLADYVSNGKPLKIFSTGCIRDINPSAVISDGWDTFFLAKWVKDHPGSELVSVEIDPEAINNCRKLLKAYDLDDHADILLGDSLDRMASWFDDVDMFVLDSCDGLEHGLEEFKAALTHNPKVIVMDDWDTKVIKAAEYAASIGIPCTRVDRYTVFQIPQPKAN